MDVLHTYSFAVGRLDLLVSFCDYVTLVQPSGKAGLGRGRHDALAGAAEERPDLAASFTCELRHTHTVDVDGQRVRSRELEQILDSLRISHSMPTATCAGVTHGLRHPSVVLHVSRTPDETSLRWSMQPESTSDLPTRPGSFNKSTVTRWSAVGRYLKLIERMG